MSKFKKLTSSDFLPLSKNSPLNLTNGFNKFINNFNNCTNGEYQLLPNQIYSGVHTELLLMHTCGKTRSISPSKLLMVSENRVRTDCPHCKSTPITTVTEQLLLLDKMYIDRPEYTITKRPTTNNGNVTVLHISCTNTFSTSIKNLLRGDSCPICEDTFGIDISNPYNLSLDTIDKKDKSAVSRFKNFLDNFKTIASSEYGLIHNQTFTNIHSKLQLKHLSCNNIYEVSPANLLNISKQVIKSNCKSCQYKKVKKLHTYTLEEFKEELSKKINYISEYEFLTPYEDTNNKLTIRHSVCNKIIQLRPRELMMGHYCPECTKSNRTSKGEKELISFVKSLIPEMETKENIFGLLENKKFELDFFIPELKLAFEYNGDWWHREEQVKDKTHKKILMCADKDIRLITIMENEWINKQDIVKDKIRYILNIPNENLQRIYARKTEVREVDSTTKNVFLEANHIQGKDISFKNLGLFFENELVAIMTICKPRKALNSDKFELSRFVTKLNTSIIGGFSKLLSHIKPHLPNVSTLLTFASLSYSVGDVYEKNGFTISHISKPSYWYVRHTNATNRKPLHRFNFNKKEIERKFNLGKLKSFDSTLTEKENMWNNGYYTYLDCGNLVYTLNL